MRITDIGRNGERMINENKGLVIWLTGLSGAGKTTLAQSLSRELKVAGIRVETLDGDEVRENLSRDWDSRKRIATRTSGASVSSRGCWLETG